MDDNSLLEMVREADDRAGVLAMVEVVLAVGVGSTGGAIILVYGVVEFVEEEGLFNR